MVMASGNQTIRPVSRYSFMGTDAPLQVVDDGCLAPQGLRVRQQALQIWFLQALAAGLSPVAGATPVAGALPPLKSVTYQPEPLS